MGHYVKTDSLPALRNYEQAERHWRGVVPIRGNGRNAGKRPLGDRRLTHMTIRKGKTHQSGQEVDVIRCRLYATDCVNFYSDGTVRLSAEEYMTLSTRAFINTIIQSFGGVVEAPKGLYNSGVSIYDLPSRRAGVYSTFDQNYQTRGGMSDKITSKHLWESSIVLGKDRLPITPERATVHRINRKAMNEVRRLNEPFLKYAKAMVKVAYPADTQVSGYEYNSKIIDKHVREHTDGHRSIYNINRSSFPDPDTVSTFCNIMRSDVIEDWADMLDICATLTMSKAWSTVHREAMFHYNPKHIHQAIDDILKRGYSNAILSEVVLPVGEVKPNPNQKYLNIPLPQQHTV